MHGCNFSDEKFRYNIFCYLIPAYNYKFIELLYIYGFRYTYDCHYLKQQVYELSLGLWIEDYKHLRILCLTICSITLYIDIYIYLINYYLYLIIYIHDGAPCFYR